MCPLERAISARSVFICAINSLAATVIQHSLTRFEKRYQEDIIFNARKVKKNAITLIEVNVKTKGFQLDKYSPLLRKERTYAWLTKYVRDKTP